MQEEDLKPNAVTIVCLLLGICLLTYVKQGKEVHDCRVRNEFELDVYVGSSLKHMYGKCET